MSQTDTDFSSLVASRLCHDLISPMGALANGVELLAMTRGTADAELSLIEDSVMLANARLRFFRIAFGAAGASTVSADESRGIVRDMFAASRLKPNLILTGSPSRRHVKLIFLLLLCVESSMPIGGRVDISLGEDGTISIAAEGQRVNVSGPGWTLLKEGCGQPVEISARDAQFMVVSRMIEEEGRTLAVETTETTLKLSA